MEERLGGRLVGWTEVSSAEKCACLDRSSLSSIGEHVEILIGL